MGASVRSLDPAAATDGRTGRRRRREGGRVAECASNAGGGGQSAREFSARPPANRSRAASEGWGASTLPQAQCRLDAPHRRSCPRVRMCGLSLGAVSVFGLAGAAQSAGADRADRRRAVAAGQPCRHSEASQPPDPRPSLPPSTIPLGAETGWVCACVHVCNTAAVQIDRYYSVCARPAAHRRIRPWLTKEEPNTV